jgi:predicted DNA-binding transcriptional regulator YafY
MANTSSRTLRLLSLLQNHRYWPGAELAARLGVSVRTLRRDVDRLRELGYPVEAHRGVDGGYQLAAGAVLPPLLVDDEEAVALAIGLSVAAQGAVAGIEESSVRALAKVVQVMPPRLRRRVDALRAVTVPAVWSTGPTVDAATLTAVAQACRDEERLRFTYTARGGERTERFVEPHRLVSLGRRWYLVAYDLTRHDWRSFRLDRLIGPSNTGERFRPRELPGEDAAAFVRAGIDNIPPAPRAVDVLVYAPAARVRGLVGQWATVEEIDDERCRMRMSTESLDWPALALGAIGAEFDILEPPELADLIREWGTRFIRATGT